MYAIKIPTLSANNKLLYNKTVEVFQGEIRVQPTYNGPVNTFNTTAVYTFKEKNASWTRKDATETLIIDQDHYRYNAVTVHSLEDGLCLKIEMLQSIQQEFIQICHRQLQQLQKGMIKAAIVNIKDNQ